MESKGARDENRITEGTEGELAKVGGASPNC